MTRVAVEFHRLAEQSGYRLAAEQPVPWLSRNGHLNPALAPALPTQVMTALARIFAALAGDERKLASKTRGTVKLDFFWGARGCAVEVDEVQHFTRHRASVLRFYPPETPLGFSPRAYISLCTALCHRAERSYSHVVVAEFPGEYSRARQRAYFDAVRDLCAPYFTQGPLLRVPAHERDAVVVLTRFAELARDLPAQHIRVKKNYANPVAVSPLPERLDGAASPGLRNASPADGLDPFHERGRVNVNVAGWTPKDRGPSEVPVIRDRTEFIALESAPMPRSQKACSLR